MVVPIVEIGSTIRFMAPDITSGKMDGNTMEPGKITTWTELVSMFILMESGTRVNIKMTRRQAMVSISGLIAASMKGGGIKANNMASEYTMTQRKIR